MRQNNFSKARPFFLKLIIKMENDNDSQSYEKNSCPRFADLRWLLFCADGGRRREGFNCQKTSPAPQAPASSPSSPSPSSLNADPKFMRFIKSAFIFFYCAASGAAFADDGSQAVSLSETPAAVQKIIQSQVGGGKMGEIDKTSNAGETVYDVDLTAADGSDRDFSVAEDGTLLSVEVPLAEMPAAAQAKRAYGWSHREGENDEGERIVTVLEIPPVVSPLTAVRVSIVADGKKRRNQEKN